MWFDGVAVALLRAGDPLALKRALADRLQAAGQRPTPRLIDQQIIALERKEAARRVIQSVEAAGGTAHYHGGVDLRDGPAVAAVVQRVRREHGRVDVLVHAAGLEISRLLQHKEPAEFDLVFDVKADGMFNLLRATAGLPVGAVVVFSSIAGRFGNAGQTDYSAANDLLCKLTSSLRRCRSEVRPVAIDWTAWRDIGMATRGSIPAALARAGVDLLPPEAGIPTVRRELICGGSGGEVVVAQALGQLLEELDPAGGLDLEAAEQRLSRQQHARLMLGQIRAAGLHSGLELETALDPRSQPFLRDHQVERDLPYLPGVMGLEAFAQLAAALAPEHQLHSVRDAQFAAPFKFYRNEPRRLLLRARVMPAGRGLLRARCELLSETPPPQPGPAPRVKLHFSAEVWLGQGAPPALTPAQDPAPDQGQVLLSAEIYQQLFHGPAYQVLERVTLAGARAWGALARDLPPDTEPAGAPLLLAPRLVELCFQTAGIWQLGQQQPMGLPAAVESVTVHHAESGRGAQLHAALIARDQGQRFDVCVTDEQGRPLVTVKGYRTIEVPR